MNLKIIQLGISHLNQCIDIDKKTLEGLWTKSQWKRELTDPKRICIGVIEMETKNLLGLCSAWFIVEELYLTLLAVDPSHQRMGLGKLLIKDLIKRSQSLLKNQILLEVKETNEPAKAFYIAMGFQLMGSRSNFYKDGSNALIFLLKTNKKQKNN